MRLPAAQGICRQTGRRNVLKARYRVIIFFSIFLSISLSINSLAYAADKMQLSQVNTWQKTIGGGLYWGANCIQQTVDGGYILSGKLYSSNLLQPSNAYLIKLDSSGSKLWEKNYAGLDGKTVIQTSDNGYLILGSALIMNSNLVVIKTDANGAEQWKGTYICPGNGIYCTSASVVQTRDGGYILAGEMNSAYLRSRAWIAKLNANGEEQWEKTFGNGVRNSFSSISKAINGGYILAGGVAAKEDVQFIGTDQDCYIAKIDEQGNLEWERIFGGSMRDQANDVKATADGGYIIAGTTNSLGAGYIDAYVVKINHNGNIEWQKTFGGAGDDVAVSIVETADRGLVFVGSIEPFGPGTKNRDVYLVKLDNAGSTIFEKMFGGDNVDSASCVVQTSDGGYAIAGGANYIYESAKPEDIYVIKTDANGEVN